MDARSAPYLWLTGVGAGRTAWGNHPFAPLCSPGPATTLGEAVQGRVPLPPLARGMRASGARRAESWQSVLPTRAVPSTVQAGG